MRLLAERERARLAGRADDAARRAARSPTRCSASPHAAQAASCGAKPGGEQQLEPEGERVAARRARRRRRRAARAGWRAGGRRRGADRRRRTGAPTASQARAAPSSAPPCSRSRGWPATRLGARDREQVAAPLVEHELQRGRTAPAARRSATSARRTPLAIARQPPALGRVQVQDAVGLAVADRAQDDRLGLQAAGHGVHFADARTILCEVMSRVTVYTTEPCGYCRTAKALLDAPRHPVRGDQPGQGRRRAGRARRAAPA